MSISTRTRDDRKLVAGIGSGIALDATLLAWRVCLLACLCVLAPAVPLRAQTITFGFPGSYSVPSPSPTGVAAGSLRSNGILDMVVANEAGGGSGGVSVLLGNGDGTFKPAVNYATSLECTAIAIGDFNGDGKPDLAATDYITGSINILLGNGDGTFQSPVSYSVAGVPNAVAVGSLRGNGTLDLVVTSVDQVQGNLYGYVSILLGNGDGTFQLAVNYGAAAHPLGVALSDFLGNGNLDVVVANYDSQSSVSLFLGNGDGTLQAGGTIPLTSADHGSWNVAVGDFNGDGKPDVAVTNELPETGGQNVTVLLGNGDGTFQPPVDYSVVPSSEPNGTQFYTETLGIAVGDFNGDGKLDLAVGSYSNAVSVLAGNGDGTFQAAVAFEAKYFFPYAEDSYPYSIAVGDFNGDAELDLAVADIADLGYASVLLNTTVELSATTTTLQSSLNPSTVGQSVTFTATVSGSGGTPTGIVTFSNGATSLSTGTILGTATLSGGAATFATSALGVGIQSITAFYGSDSSFRSSTSAVLKQTVHGLVGVAGVSPSSLTFGNQDLGTTSASQPVTLSNTGIAALAISSIATSANFGQTNNCGVSVAVGGYCTINVTFSPAFTAAAGTLTGLLTVTDNSNGVAGSTQMVSLTGVATAVAQPSVSILDFGNQILNTTGGPRTETLSNPGATTLAITNISASGPFVQTNTCGTSLAPSASCNLVITFTPTSLGSQSGAVTVTYGGPATPQVVVLAGTGISAQTTSCPTNSQQASVNYGHMPLSFEANAGQTDSQVKFLSRGRGYGLFLTGDEVVLDLKTASLVPGPLSLAKAHRSGAKIGLQRTNDKGQMTKDSYLRMKLVGANQDAAVTGDNKLPGKMNYFMGNDPKKWTSNAPTYAQVRYRDVYPGIDLVYHGSQDGQLEYDFVVGPGADPSAILLGIDAAGQVDSERILRVPKPRDGQKAVGSGSQGQAATQSKIQNLKSKIGPNGDLVIKTYDGEEIRFHKPVVYQEKESGVRNQKSGEYEAISDLRFENRQSTGNLKSKIQNRKFLSGRFALDAQNRVHFMLGDYDHSRPLVIDPVLVYSTYLGGSGSDGASGIAVDSSCNAYIVGSTTSFDFPTASPFQASLGATGSANVFVSKLDPTGTALLYSTFLGGNSYDFGYAIAVDSSGNAYVNGYTQSPNFPTVNPLQANLAGSSNGFVSKLNPTGSALVYSTYLGGNGQTYNDYGYGIAVDSSGDAYVTGQTDSTNFPTKNPIQASLAGSINAYVAELNPAGSALVYSTYLGGNGNDYGDAIALDSSHNAYVAGGTDSTNFPTAHPLQSSLAGSYNAIVVKVNSTGSALVYSTYLGGSGSDGGFGITADSSGNAYVTGGTGSLNFPTTPGVFQPCLGIAGSTCLSSTSANNAFVSKLSWTAATSTLSLAYSTFLGGSGNIDNADGIAVDSSGNAYVVGATNSPNFPTTPGAFQTSLGGAGAANAFVTEVNPAGSALVYSTYLGGNGQDYGDALAVDSSGNAYVTGSTNSPNFPTTPDAFQTSLGGTGATNAFIAEISTLAVAPAVTLSGNSITFSNQVQGSTSAIQSVTLTNTGTAALIISGIGINGDFALAATATACPSTGSALAPGAACTVDVTFTPTDTGTRSGSVTITDNASGSPQAVSLSGMGTTSGGGGGGSSPVSVADTETVTVADTPIIVATPPLLTASAPVAYYSVGSLGFQGETATLPVTVSNLGQAALSLVSVSSPGSPFSIDQIACTNGTTSLPTTLPPAGACVFSVSYVEPPSGSPNGTITFTDNAALSNLTSTAVSSNFTQTVPLSGSGTSTAPPSPPPSSESAPVSELITVVDRPIIVATPPLLTASAPAAYYSVGSLGFQGQSATLPLTVSNLGQATLSLDSVSSPGSPFSITQIACTNAATSLPTTLPPAGACVFSISYVAPPSGSPTGALTFTDNAALSNLTSTAVSSNFTQTVPLSGSETSTAPPSPPPSSESASVSEPITVVDTPIIVATPPLLTASAPVAYYSVGSLGFQGQSATLPLTVSNLGQAALSLDSVSSPGSPFGITQIACTNAATSLPTTLPPAGACVFSISYVAPPSGSPTDSITFTDNAVLSNLTSTAVSSNFTQTVPLSGSGTSTAPPAPPASSVSVTVNETITVVDTVTLTGTDVNAAASATPASLSFGNQVVNTSSAAKKVTFISTGTVNVGRPTITITGTNAGDFSQTNTCTAVSYAPGTKCAVEVTFSPSVLGAESATLTLTDNGANSPQTVALAGTGEQPVAPHPSSLSFGNVGENSPSAAKTITLTNNQSVALTVSSITFTGTNAGDFGETDTCSGGVAAKSTCTISVTFTPSTLSAETASLAVADIASNSPQTVALAGTGIVPATLSPASLNLGKVPQGIPSATKNITLSNKEAVPLTIASIATGNGDFTESDTCDGSVPAKSDCVITVTFTPSIIGAETGTLTVADAASNSPQTAALAGTGIEQATASPTSLTFATEKVGTTSAAKNVTLTNNLSTPLTIGTVTFTGSNPGDFASPANTCGGSLAANSTCTISVTFKAGATGSRTATMNVNDGATNSPQSVALTGAGK